MKRIVAFSIFCSQVVFAGTADFNAIGILSDSGIFGPSYSVQVENMQSLAAANSWVEYVNYGQSIEGRQLSGMLLRSEGVDMDSLIVITGATHGNEYLNIVDQLVPQWTTATPESLTQFLDGGGAVFVVPIMNPDGYDNRTRGNKNYKDLNRDWPTLGNKLANPTEVETFSLYTYVKNFTTTNDAKLEVAIDYHCCVNGMLLLPFGWKYGEYMMPEDQSRSRVVQKLYSEAFPSPGRIGTPPDLLYSAIGTTLDYWHMDYGAVSFTYEGRRDTEPQQLPYHLSWWNQIFSWVGDQ